MEITGDEVILARLDWLIANATAYASRGLSRAARPMVREIKERTSYPFQVVPSYLERHKFDDRAKAYPPGTVATFARGTGMRALQASTLATFLPGTKRLPVQLFLDGPHITNTKVTHTVANISPTEAQVDVGYTEADSQAHPSIAWTLLGTRKMIPRPFLQETVRDKRDLVTDALTKEFETMLRQGSRFMTTKYSGSRENRPPWPTQLETRTTGYTGGPLAGAVTGSKPRLVLRRSRASAAFAGTFQRFKPQRIPKGGSFSRRHVPKPKLDDWE